MKYFTWILVAGSISVAMISAVHPATSVPANLTIMDGSSYNLHSDSEGKAQPNLYTDSILPNGDPCVSGMVNSTGYTVFYPDAKLSNGTFCNAGLPESEQRTYVFLFPYGNGNPIGGYPGPCQYLHVLEGTDSLGYPTGYCTVETDPLEYERIILGSPFASKPSTGQMHFSLSYNGVQYGVITDTNGSVLTIDANTRLVTYTGTAKLYLPNGTRFQQLTYSFNLPFQMQAKRVPQ
jgi:hypothetical protein